jgi:enoyl-CoA hydratase
VSDGVREVLLRERPRPGVVQLTLHRPEALNALDPALFAAIASALKELASDRDCRGVVLTGAGRAFCAGGDMVEFARLAEESAPGDIASFWAYQRRSAELVPLLRRLPQPVIAAVNGPAVGGGLSLACASDIRLASHTARFACAGRRVGLSAADMGVGWLLPRLVGLARAQELMLTGREFSAAEARAFGLLARVHEPPELLDAALEVAERIASQPPLAMRVTKEAVWDSLEMPSLRAAIDLESRHQAMLVQGLPDAPLASGRSALMTG